MKKITKKICCLLLLGTCVLIAHILVSTSTNESSAKYFPFYEILNFSIIIFLMAIIALIFDLLFVEIINKVFNNNN